LLTAQIYHRTFITNPVGPNNDTPPIGIACLKTAGQYLLINNVGRNFEIAQPGQSELKSLAHFARSVSNDQDEIDFDLDMHAMIYNRDWRKLLALNHDGRIRMFNTEAIFNTDAQNPTNRESVCLAIEPERELLWKSDVEHTLFIGNCLVSSSPLGYHSSDSIEPGLVVSKPIEIGQGVDLQSVAKIDQRIELAPLGMISALAFNKDKQRLALAVDGNIFLVSTHLAEDGSLSFKGPLWHTRVDFRTSYLTFAKGDTLIAGGYELGLVESELDPTNLKGGGFAVINTGNGAIRFDTNLKQNLAWGTSGECLTLSKDCSFLLGVDRYANLYRWSLETGVEERLIENEQRTDRSLGIAHLAWLGEHLYCGFNRDGNRLHVYETPSTPTQGKRQLCLQ
jgi:hypothetical protein